LNGCI